MERAQQVKRELTSQHYLMLVGFATNLIRRHLVLSNRPGVVNGTIDLMREMAATDSTRYGVQDLIDLLDRAESEPRIAPLILSRVYLVLREFLEYPILRYEVDRLLNSLIGSGRHQDALKVVKRLRFAARFDHIEWWKQLLARADTATRSGTLQEIWSTLSKDRPHVPQILRQLGGWLPASDASVDWPWCTGANDIMFLAVVDSIESSLFRKHGHWPHGRAFAPRTLRHHETRRRAADHRVAVSSEIPRTRLGSMRAT